MKKKRWHLSFFFNFKKVLINKKIIPIKILCRFVGKSYFKIQGKNPSKGQIVVEYVLLLLIGIGIASLVVSELVSRDPQNPGFLIKKWYQFLTLIATDLPEGFSIRRYFH